MKTANQLELIIPASLWPDANSRSAVWQGLELPALARLYGKARIARQARNTSLAPSLTGHGFDNYLAQLFGLSQLQHAPQRLAALDGAGEDIDSGFWLCADPVSLRVDRDHLTPIGEPFLNITQSEADELIAALNRLYQPDGYRFIAPQADRWLVRFPAAPTLTFTPIKQALGRNLNDVLPTGEGALKFNALQNEMQMLLYAHPVNDRRDAAGLPLINSVWLWGGGEYPFPQPPTPQRAIFGRDALVQAMSGQRDYPTQFDELSHTDAVVILDELELHAIYGAGYDWQQTWLRWEKHWFAPALAALQSGKLSSLTLTFTDINEQRVVKKSNLWRFWRRDALPIHSKKSGEPHVAD
ncbi:hypothetical protein [Chitinibacter sp. S2-10]|uniref:hypothetical protein n=1 Tax=Chitinibacter sp. S2-10 TaxID=3373597 RepID=UPI00397786F7